MTNPSLLFCFYFSLFLSLLTLSSSTLDNRQVYIVYFGEHTEEKAAEDIEDGHHSVLLSVKNSDEEARASLLYSYKNSINGFAALLSEEEAGKLSEKEEVISAFPSQANSLQTTRSWEFLEFEEGLLERKGKGIEGRARGGQDIIVGLLDSGIWPESRSFSDKGMGPIPKSWKGICQEGEFFNSSHCNRKVIGARYYLKAYEYYHGRLDTTAEYRSPRDHDGHGTHTSSTVGGRRVRGVSSLGGFARGTASGGAPLVRLAMYKVCWPIPGVSLAVGNTCLEADMLAAIDDALGDGVDVLSISIGTSGTPPKYTEDGIAIGALHAVKRNVVVACSAGNSGPTPATVSNLAPWIITVGASSVDRLFPSPVVLGNGIEIKGQSVTPYELHNKHYPLVFAADAVVPGTPKNSNAGQCLPGSLDPNKVRSKIILCLRGNGTRVGKGMEVKRAGGAALILGNSLMNGDEISVDAHVLPGTAVISDDATAIVKYINSTNRPTANILPATTVLNVQPAPFMAAFSSTGPNALDPNILKPDITAPGLNILAAWSESSPPTKLEGDPRRVKYNIISGTSMSCPHVAAAAALLKAIYPYWTAAAIRSALMTTATVANNEGKLLTDAFGNVAGPFNYGSGHIRPTHASDPGLVYDASYTDYLLYLCSLGINVDRSFKCPGYPISPTDLNHPSVAIPKLKGTLIVKRTVTSVTNQKSTYSLTVHPPSGISVEITPKILSFNGVSERKSFSITFEADESNGRKKLRRGEYVFGWYAWSDGVHVVRSPMAVALG
ncbi:subtilisin-like protease SBT5.6 [Magnolia sinica]|uniref:subtilisin-like protease SBT5.6 n=1 Tax=Magnolia sinica TaxID=86752 RepID=UPI00265B2048|nr:subtilisin-like protease SBT5.6 [Magnolia sinica]